MNNNRQLITIIVVILVILIAGIGIFQALAKGSTGGSTATTPKPVNLTDYSNNAAAMVTLSVIGPVTAKEHHLVQTMSVSLAHRELDVSRGYTGSAEQSSPFDNNQPAFEDFITALSNAGFTRTIKPRGGTAATSETGLCPNGTRYVYELTVNGQSLSHNYATSCNNPTTFGGQVSVISNLFQSQIPGYGKLLSTVKP